MIRERDRIKRCRGKQKKSARNGGTRKSGD